MPILIYSPHGRCGFSDDCFSGWFVFDGQMFFDKIEMSCIKCGARYHVQKNFGVKIMANSEMERFIRWANT